MSRILKRELINLLNQGQAFKPLKKALNEVKTNYRNTKLHSNTHSIWALMEHMRIAQKDIIDFMFNENFKELKWPDEYWPDSQIDFSDSLWDKTISNFWKDFDFIVNWIETTEIDLTSELSHAKGYTYLREILLIADHNACHTGQILQIIKTLQ